MRGALVMLIGANLALAALMLATRASGLGAERAHHDAAYVALALVAAGLALAPAMRRRRVVTLAMASLGAWAMLSGFLLVYVEQVGPTGRWLSWWHGATSVGFLLAFLAHWARNQPRLGQLARKLARAPRARLATAAAWAFVAVLVVASWATPLAVLFDDAAFRALTTLSLGLLVVALLWAYLLTGGPRARTRRGGGPARDRLRGALDASLLAATWLAALTGFPLLYFARDLRGVDAYWHVAGWHVVLSVLLLGLALGHAALNRRPLRAHALGGRGRGGGRRPMGP